MKTLKAHTEQRVTSMRFVQPCFSATLITLLRLKTSEWEGVSERARASGKSKFRYGSRNWEKRIAEEEGRIVWKEAEKEELHQTLVSRLPTDTPDDDEVDPSGTGTLPPPPPSSWGFVRVNETDAHLYVLAKENCERECVWVESPSGFSQCWLSSFVYCRVHGRTKERVREREFVDENWKIGGKPEVSSSLMWLCVRMYWEFISRRHRLDAGGTEESGVEWGEIRLRWISRMSYLGTKWFVHRWKYSNLP